MPAQHDGSAQKLCRCVSFSCCLLDTVFRTLSSTQRCSMSCCDYRSKNETRKKEEGETWKGLSDRALVKCVIHTSHIGVFLLTRIHTSLNTHKAWSSYTSIYLYSVFIMLGHYMFFCHCQQQAINKHIHVWERGLIIFHSPLLPL